VTAILPISIKHLQGENGINTRYYEYSAGIPARTAARAQKNCNPEAWGCRSAASSVEREITRQTRTATTSATSA